MSTSARAPRPAGFTIVELLIVIVIIVVLAGLLLPAVLNALNLAKVTATRQEINTMRVALDQYQLAFGCYPPSCIWWHRDDGNSITWPNDWPQPARWSLTSPGGTNVYKMDGAECLVYFLGGGPYARGFTAGTQTFGPYLPVQGDMLVDRNGQPLHFPMEPTNGFGAIQDPFRHACVYLYFTADRTRPGSEYTAADNWEMVDAGGMNPDGSRILPSPGEPIRDPSGNYYCPTTYQVFSAGRDERYGRRGDQDPSRDDITNFSSR